MKTRESCGVVDEAAERDRRLRTPAGIPNEAGSRVMSRTVDVGSVTSPSGGATFVAVMQAAYLGEGDDRACAG